MQPRRAGFLYTSTSVVRGVYTNTEYLGRRARERRQKKGEGIDTSDVRRTVAAGDGVNSPDMLGTEADVAARYSRAHFGGAGADGWARWELLGSGLYFHLSFMFGCVMGCGEIDNAVCIELTGLRSSDWSSFAKK